jgi:hypothetical protein
LVTAGIAGLRLDGGVTRGFGSAWGPFNKPTGFEDRLNGA